MTSLEELRRLFWAMEEAKAAAAQATAAFNAEFIRQKRDAGLAPGADFDIWAESEPEPE